MQCEHRARPAEKKKSTRKRASPFSEPPLHLLLPACCSPLTRDAQQNKTPPPPLTTNLEEQDGVHVVTFDFPPLRLSGCLLFHEVARNQQGALIKAFFSRPTSVFVSPIYLFAQSKFIQKRKKKKKNLQHQTSISNACVRACVFQETFVFSNLPNDRLACFH